jgi:predicted anti-sigma-YlaC factor YlaD
MTKHFSEAELLETYYTQPGESMPVMMHLAACSDCAARYERLERKLRSLASCVREKPETFWTRQRMLIMRGIEKRKQHGETAVRTWRVAAAAVLAFFLGGMFVYKTVEPRLNAPKTTTTSSVVVTTASATLQPRNSATSVDTVAHDAWQSDELRDFHGLVAWESWVDSKDQQKEGSL